MHPCARRLVADGASGWTAGVGACHCGSMPCCQHVAAAAFVATQPALVPLGSAAAPRGEPSADVPYLLLYRASNRSGSACIGKGRTSLEGRSRVHELLDRSSSTRTRCGVDGKAILAAR